MSKIDSSKLLPPSKSSAIAPYRKPTIIGATKTAKITSAIQPINLASKSSAIVKKKNEETLNDVVGKLVKIEGVLIGEQRLLQSQQRSTEIKKEQEDSKKEEEKLEEPKAKGFKFPKLPELPTIGSFERIKRFLFFTALGWLLPKIIEFLPKLEGIVKTIGTVYGFAENLFGKLLDGFSSLVKFGGDLTKKTLGFITQTGLKPGEKFDDKFNALETTFNRFVDASIIAGLLSADLGLAAFDEYKKLKGKNKPGAEPKKGGKPPVPRGRVQVTEGRGGQPGLGRGARVTESKPQSWWSKLTEKIKGSFADFRKSVFSKIVEPFKNLIKPFSRLKGPLSKFGGAVIPGLGAVVGAIDAKDRFSRGDNLGGTLASISATLDTLTVGSALTGIGIPVAALFGTISMAIDVIVLIRDLLQIAGVPDKLLGFAKGGRVIRRYQGGGTTPTRGGQPVAAVPRRSIKIEKKKKPFKLPPTQTKPGKDVGGEEKIKILYPEPKKPLTLEQWMSKGDMAGSYPMYLESFNQSKEDKKPDAFTALTSVAKTVKPIDVVGQLMGAGVDLALGQAPDKKIFNSFFDNIGYLADTWMNQRMNRNISLISREISSFADGGKVPPSRELRDVNNNESFGDVLTKLLGPMINQRINQSLQYLKKEIQKKPEKEKGDVFDNLPGEPGSIEGVQVGPNDIIGTLGSTGRSTGPHIHIEDFTQKGSKIPDDVKNNILVSGVPMPKRLTFTSGIGWRWGRRHNGEDFAGPRNQPISLTGGLKFVRFIPEGDPTYSGYGNVVIISSPNGRQYLLGHLNSGPKDLRGLLERQRAQANLNIQTGGFNVSGGNADFWTLAAIAALENDTAQGRADVAQAIYNRVASGLRFGQKSNTIKGHIVAISGGTYQFSPVRESNPSLWNAIRDKQSAIAAIESHRNGRGRGEKLINAAAAAITNRELQRKAAEYIGGRTDFWSTSMGMPSSGIGFVVRDNHRFGWFSGPEAIAYGRRNPGPARIPGMGNVRVETPLRPQTTIQQQETRPQTQNLPPPTRSLLQLQEQIKNMKIGGPPVIVEGLGRVTLTGNQKTFYIGNNKVEPSEFFEAYRRGRTQTPSQGGMNQSQTQSSRPLKEPPKNVKFKLVDKGWISFTFNGKPYEFRFFYGGKNDPNFRLRVKTPGFFGGDVQRTREMSEEIVRKIMSMYSYQKGGLISPSKPTRTIPNSFASYENYGQGTLVAMQPIIIERPVPMNSSGSGVIAFPVPVSVNNNIDDILKFSRG